MWYTRKKKLLGLLSVSLLFVTLPLAVAVVWQQTHLTHHGASLRPTDGYGVYEDCAPADPACLAHLQTLAAGGFKLVLNYASIAGSASEVRAYADAAHAAGLKIIWSLHSPLLYLDGKNPADYYPAMAASCNCSDGPTFDTFVVNLVKGHTATWGYYVGDELKSPAYPSWKHFTDRVHNTDPTHPRLVIESTVSKLLLNSADPNLPLFGSDTEVLGDDYYPIGYNAILPYTQTGKIARDVQTAATSLGKDSAFVLQAYSMPQIFKYARCTPWPTCAPFPSLDQMTSMLKDVLQNAHPRLVLWYGSYYLQHSDDPTRHWNDLVTAINTFYSPLSPSPTPTSNSSVTSMPTTKTAEAFLYPASKKVTVGSPNFSVNLTVDGGGQSFRTVQATVLLSSNVQIVNILAPSAASHACNITFIPRQVPTSSNPSFGVTLLSASSTPCTVYTLLLQATAPGQATVTLTNVSVTASSNGSNILQSISNGTYTAV